MAVCLHCAVEMSQTQAVCPVCGHDYHEPEETWRDLIFRKTSLREMFLVTTVVGFPLALWHWFAPAIVGEEAQHFRSATGYFLLSLGVCSYISSQILEDAAPIWARLFAAVGVFSLATWPFWLF